jgi:exopolyphosphatase/guanosine-5'-triphosphate,3'-diphosphate pyrophosphatase
MKNRIAIIDIGTNTFNLLVVDRLKNQFEIIYKERIGVGLGNKGINTSIIAPSAFKRGIKTLNEYKNKCLELNVETIRAIGTSAIRNAKNQSDFLIAVKQQTGITINIISGSEEAKHIYHGVKINHDFDTPSVIMDIGGGSTEFIFANQSGIMDKASFEIGVSRIYQHLEKPKQLNEEMVAKIERHLERQTEHFFDKKSVDVLIGSSGSFKTFYELYDNKQYPRDEYVKIEMLDLISNLNHIIYSSKKERDNNHYIIPIRKKMINIAAVKTNWIIKKLGIKEFIVSPYSLKEGAIFYDSTKILI